MIKDYLKDFEDSLNTLEDIQLLSEFSISPLISRAYFHLSEMKRKADMASSGKVSEYDSVLKVLDEKLESIFVDFFSNKNKFRSYTYTKRTDKIDLKKWNLLLNSVPEILSVVTLFNFYGNVELELNEDKILLKGVILEDQTFEHNRKFVYVVTRKLLKSNVLLTFELEKTTRAGLYQISLEANIAHDEKLVYKTQFKDSNVLLGFSNIFPQYRVKADTLNDVGDHAIVEIMSDLSVIHKTGRVSLSKIDSANKEILHFPFLFRPLSIILPVKGHLSSDAFLGSLQSLERTMKDTGSEDHNQNSTSVLHYRYIDFFSLFA